MLNIARNSDEQEDGNRRNTSESPSTQHDQNHTPAQKQPVSSGELQGANRDALIHDADILEEEERPPLPPRPSEGHRATDANAKSGSLKINKSAPRPQLLSKATTAVSKTDIQTQSKGETTSTSPRPGSRAASIRRGFSSSHHRSSPSAADLDEVGSIRSYDPYHDTSGDVESLIGGIVDREEDVTEGQTSVHVDFEPWAFSTTQDDTLDAQFEKEFDSSQDSQHDPDQEEKQMLRWRGKLKHYFILSSAGKPIYSRHGDDQVISNSIGVIQTIISFYQEQSDPLKSFLAGGARFCVLSKGHLHMVAISRLGENETQLAAQLEALYMQILSALTLPKMQKIFLNRPSTDLRRPLEGTEPLLSALADGFTKGSPPNLLSALECLRMKKRDRETINRTMIKCRSDRVVYGLIVAGGRLVSVLRPKKHSLHPGDLHLIFNMLFEADGIRTAGGENWIPLCLPGFNNQGYLYMYVSFLDRQKEETEDRSKRMSMDRHTAIILISADNESFFELQKVRDKLVEQLQANGGLQLIQKTVEHGRLKCTDMVPGTVLRHFLYKSRANVQFFMPAAESQFQSLIGWRKLISHYCSLHATVHDRTSHLKVHYCASDTISSMVWVSPIFELYCIASPSTSRTAIAQAANKLAQWAAREEERMFIIGGAVY